MQTSITEQNSISRYLRFEETILSILLLAMIVLACLQIVLRSFFSSGLLWADPLLRYMVIWSGMLGAALATSCGKHIALDLISYLVPASVQSWITVVTHLFSTTVAGFLTYASYLFIKNEIEFGSSALLSVPSWVWNLIFPLAFAIITLRFLTALLQQIRAIFTSSSHVSKG